MKLDRNINGNGRGKYALVKLRVLKTFQTQGTFGGGLPDNIQAALDTLSEAGALDWGDTGTESEFFLIRLKDRHAKAALEAYARSAIDQDPEYAAEIDEMATRAGPLSLFCKEPD